MQLANGVYFPDSDIHMRDQHLAGKTQHDTLLKALTFCTKTRTVLNAGAHVGIWAARYAEIFDEVIAMEPCLDTYECLVQNTKSFPNVRTIPAGLSNFIGTAGMQQDARHAGNTGGNYLVEGGQGCTITTVDSLAITDLDLLSFDLEGHEHQALQGAAETIKKCWPVILCEEKGKLMARQGNAPESVFKYLSGLGYRRAAQIRRDFIYVKGA